MPEPSNETQIGIQADGGRVVQHDLDLWSCALPRRRFMRCAMAASTIAVVPMLVASGKKTNRIGFVDNHLDNYHARVYLNAIRETLTGKTAELLKGVSEVELSVIQHPSPGRALVEMAEDEGADLIILGSHGRSGLSRAFLGSVAERVVRHAPCPVLVVRGRCDNKPKDGE